MLWRRAAFMHLCEDGAPSPSHFAEDDVIRPTPIDHPHGTLVPWMAVALAERGVRRFPPGRVNPRIVEYNGHTNLVGYDDKISWCSSFVNWCMARAGLRGTGSALARSWLEWGRPLAQPVYGCIAVLTREDPASWKGHVGFICVTTMRTCICSAATSSARCASSRIRSRR